MTDRPQPPASTDPAAQADASIESEQPVAPPSVDPMKGFRGVMAGTMVLQAIVMALSLLVIDRLYGGVSSVLGFVVLAVVAALVAGCWLLKYSWSVGFVLFLQLVGVLCIIGSVPVGIVGILFAAIWIYLFWLRRDVARRMAAGRLPSQQPDAGS
jgi:hypothetical protein